MSKYAKFVTAAVGAAAALVATGLLPDNVATWVQGGIAVVTAVAVLLIPNWSPPVKAASKGE